MKCIVYPLLLAALVAAPPALAQSAAITGATGAGAAAAPSRMDRQFVTQAAAAGLAEVEAGRLALEKTASDDVRRFAQMIVDDHTRANEELKTIAAQKNLTLPTAPDAEERRKIDKLRTKSGDAFDQAFLKNEREDHRESIALFSKQAKSGSDPDLQKFAADTLPKLEQHLQHAEALQGASGSTGR